MGSVCSGNNKPERYNKPEGKNNNNNKISELPEGIQEIIIENPNIAMKLFNASHKHAMMRPNRAMKLKEDKKDKIILNKILDLNVEFSKRMGDNYNFVHPWLPYGEMWPFMVRDKSIDGFMSKVKQLVCQLSEPLQDLLIYIYEDLDRLAWLAGEGTVYDPSYPADMKPKVYKEMVDILLQKLINMLFKKNIDYREIRDNWNNMIRETLENFQQINFAQFNRTVRGGSKSKKNIRGVSRSKRNIRGVSRSKRNRNII